MGLFDKLLRKKTENGVVDNVVASSNSKEKPESEVELIKQKSPVKEPEISEKRPASKWNDPEYLRSLNKALKSNPKKSIIQTIADTQQELTDKRQQASEESIELTTKTEEIQNPTPFSVKITTRWVECDPIGDLSHLDFGKPTGVLGCFLNYSNYKVMGNDDQGKRRIKIRTGINEQQALEKAINEGLLAPFKTEVIGHDTPTERQLDCLKSHGAFIPDGITKDDASCMISRLVDDDLDSPAPWLVALANGLNTNFSAFIGARGLFSSVIYQANERDRAALFGYAVRQNLQGSGLGNMLEDPAVGSFYDFADQVAANPALLRSLNGREPADYIRPHKGTAIYKAAAALFSGGGA